MHTVHWFHTSCEGAPYRMLQFSNTPCNIEESFLQVFNMWKNLPENETKLYYIWYHTSHCCHQKSEECRRMCSKTWQMDMKFCIRGWYPQSDTYTLYPLLSLFLLLLDSLASLLLEWTSVSHASCKYQTIPSVLVFQERGVLFEIPGVLQRNWVNCHQSQITLPSCTVKQLVANICSRQIRCGQQCSCICGQQCSCICGAKIFSHILYSNCF